MQPHVRRATPADLARLVAIERAAGVNERTEQQYARELELAWSRVEVLELPQEGVVAFCVAWLVPDDAELHFVAVHPEHQRRGFARILLDSLRRQAAEHGAEAINLEVRRSNEAARTLYLSLGFVEIGVRPRYYQRENEDAILMRLALSPAPRGV